MLTVSVSNQSMVSYIVDEIVGLFEAASCEGPLGEGNYILHRFRDDKGEKRRLTVSLGQMIEAYNCHGTDKVPSYLKDQKQLEFIYRTLKGL